MCDDVQGMSGDWSTIDPHEGYSEKIDPDKDPNEVIEYPTPPVITLDQQFKTAVRTGNLRAIIKRDLEYHPSVGDTIRLETPDGADIARVVVTGRSQWAAEHIARGSIDGLPDDKIDEMFDAFDNTNLTLGTELQIIHFIQPWLVINDEWDLWFRQDATSTSGE